MDVSVVICTYTEERWDALVAAERAARDQTLAPREVIVVVDHNEALLERARSGLATALVVPNQVSTGASGSRNTAAAVARGRVLAFLDDDVDPARDWLERLVAPLGDGNVLGTGGRLDPSWQTERPAWFPPEFDWVIGCTYRGMPESRGAIRNPIGASMAIRRSVITALGGFRTDTGPRRNLPGGHGMPGTEETELAIRATKRWPGGRWMYVPDARALHWVPAERSTWRYFRIRCRGEGRAKAAMAAVSGRSSALASERAYARRALPRALASGVGDALLRGDRTGLLRAAAVLVGVAEAVAGYVGWYLRPPRVL